MGTDEKQDESVKPKRRDAEIAKNAQSKNDRPDRNSLRVLGASGSRVPEILLLTG
jgi:hypothetical protein